MTAPEQQAAPGQADLRKRIAQALSEAGAFCGECGFEPGETGCPDCVRVRQMYVTAVLAVVEPELAKRHARGDIWKAKAAELEQDRDRLAAELAALREQHALLQAGAAERQALLDEARDALEAAGVTGAHGDDWPAIAPAIRALAAERDQLREQHAATQAENERLRLLLAHDHHLAYHQGEPRDDHCQCGRESCQSTNPLYPPPVEPLPTEPST